MDDQKIEDVLAGIPSMTLEPSLADRTERERLQKEDELELEVIQKALHENYDEYFKIDAEIKHYGRLLETMNNVEEPQQCVIKYFERIVADLRCKMSNNLSSGDRLEKSENEVLSRRETRAISS